MAETPYPIPAARKPIAIFDIDNCIADDEWRLSLIDWSKTDLEERYANYHRACGGDDAQNVDIIQAHHAKGHGIVFITARPLWTHHMTEQWLMRHLGDIPFGLMMRNNNDSRGSVEIKRQRLADLFNPNNYHPAITRSHIVCAYDDRQDIVDMYNSEGLKGILLAIHGTCAMTPPAKKALKAPPQMTGAAAVLSEGAKTFAERNAVYGSNYKMVAPLMRTLFPQGVPSDLVFQDHFHLFELMIVKLSRFAISNLTHQDSIHDLMVYAAMIESIIKEQQQ